MNKRVTIFLYTVMIAVMPATGMAHNIKPEVIDLEVDSSGALVMKTPSKCPAEGGSQGKAGFPEAGCVRAPKGEALEVEFKLTGNLSIPGVCVSPEKYQLSGIQLGGKNSTKPTLAEWETPTSLLDAVVLADFVADPVTGWANFDTKQNGNIVLRNNNGSRYGYFIWYRVRATCSDPATPNPIYYDPRFDNEGNY